MFQNPLTNIIGYGVAILALIGVLWGAKVMYDNGIKREERLQLTIKQMKQAEKERTEELAREKKIKEEAEKRIEKLLADKKELEKKIADALEFIDSKGAIEKDKESSDLLKETLKRLGADK